MFDKANAPVPAAATLMNPRLDLTAFSLSIDIFRSFSRQKNLQQPPLQIHTSIEMYYRQSTRIPAALLTFGHFTISALM